MICFSAVPMVWGVPASFLLNLGECLFYREKDSDKGCLNLVKRCVKNLAILLFLY